MANPPESNNAPSQNDSTQIEQEVKGDRTQVIGQANYSQIVQVNEGGTVNVHQPSHELDTSIHIPNNLPRSGAIAFVGRDDLLERLETQLQSNERIGITGVRGMGGIGKTELALQYAIYNKKIYPGGVCWLRARDQEIATQVVSFAKANLGIKPPDDMEADEQVRFTWQRWPKGDSLIILDDVTEYDAIALYLPPPDPRFKVLMTTRLNFGSSVSSIEIEELTDEAAIALLKSIAGDERVESQIDDALSLCDWVGNLPLGLELLGRFLARKLDWAIAKLLERLKSKNLAAKALVSSESGMTATLGVAAALELSWAELNEPERDLACLLGMFAVAPIPWNLVKQCFDDVDDIDLEDRRDEGLCDRCLIKRVEEGIYQLHQIVQEFCREKLKKKGDDAIGLKSAFGQVMVAQAQILDITPTLEQIEEVRGAIVHLEETANHWLQELSDKDIIWTFVGVGGFYEGQGNYGLAEPWYLNCWKASKSLLGKEHPYVAISLNNLAGLYDNQGRYGEAEVMYLDALALRYKVLGEEHPLVANSLNNLAVLYVNQGRYNEAGPLYLESLALRKKVLGKEHPCVATSLNNLAGLLDILGRYEEAESLYLEALALRKKLFSEEHPDVATSLNNLALLYDNQRRYEEAEQIYLESLALRKKVLGEEHVDVATSYFNLGVHYDLKREYRKAKSLYLHALEIYHKRLGTNHKNTLNLLSWFNDLPMGIKVLPLEDLGL